MIRPGRIATATAAATAAALLLLLVGPAARADEADDAARARVRFAEARLAHALKKHAEAVRLLDDALKLDPAHLGARHLRGVTLATLGRHRAAERDLMTVSYRRPTDVPLRRLLAQVLLAQSKHMWAARQYQRLTQLTPHTGDVWLGYGYCLYKLGETDEARKALTKARALGPRGVANRARVLLGLLLQQAGKLRKARHLLAGIKGPAADAADQLINVIHGAEGRRGRGLTLTFTAGAGYDSNVSTNPLDSQGSGSNGAVIQLSGSLSWLAFTWGRYGIGVNGALSRTFAVNTWDDSSCVSDYSMLIGTIAPYWNMRLSTGAYDHKLGVGYRGQLITMDGDCSPEAKPYVFSESHGGSLGWSTSWSDRTSTNLSFELGYAMFHRQVRDNLGAGLDLTQPIFLAKRRVTLYPGLAVRYEHARGAEWTYASFKPSLAVSALLPAKIDLIAWASFELQRYPTSDGYNPYQTPSGAARADYIGRVGIRVGRSITRWLRADLVYRYRRNKSNARPYDYDRHAVTLSLTAQVDLLHLDRKKKKGGHK